MPFHDESDTPPGDTEPSFRSARSPGRDSSRLMQDLLEHVFADPQIQSSPRHFDPTKPHTIPEPSHTHSWVMKAHESIKMRPWNAHYEDQTVGALCETCRLHMSMTATITADGEPKCGTMESNYKSHHFHLESWSSNTRYSSSQNSIESKPEYGSFRCCQCPLELHIDFLLPVVPEYLLSSLKKRKTGSNSALNLINRSKESKIFATKAFGTLSTYCNHALITPKDERRDINLMSEGPFARKVGLDPDVRMIVTWSYTHHNGMKLCIRDDYFGNYSKLQRLNLQNSTLSVQRIVTRVIFVPVTSLIFPSKLLDFEPNITSAMVDIARLMAAPWPRSGITLPPSDLTVGFTTRLENYFRKSINLDDPVNAYTIHSLHF
jgi:hypothetical protein